MNFYLNQGLGMFIVISFVFIFAFFINVNISYSLKNKKYYKLKIVLLGIFSLCVILLFIAYKANEITNSDLFSTIVQTKNNSIYEANKIIVPNTNKIKNEYCNEINCKYSIKDIEIIGNNDFFSKIKGIKFEYKEIDNQYLCIIDKCKILLQDNVVIIK